LGTSIVEVLFYFLPGFLPGRWKGVVCNRKYSYRFYVFPAIIIFSAFLFAGKTERRFYYLKYSYGFPAFTILRVFFVWP
jgi:hypothetical protein